MTPAAVYEYEPTAEEKAVAARGFWIMLRPGAVPGWPRGYYEICGPDAPPGRFASRGAAEAVDSNGIERVRARIVHVDGVAQWVDQEIASMTRYGSPRRRPAEAA